MLNDRPRKVLMVLWNLYRNEAVRLDRGRLGNLIGLSNDQIDEAMAELENKGRIVVKEGLLQVIEPWNAIETYRLRGSS